MAGLSCGMLLLEVPFRFSDDAPKPTLSSRSSTLSLAVGVGFATCVAVQLFWRFSRKSATLSDICL